ncbi:hypothetical protein KEJ32_05135, partial [Candidatus Bathyarchaeota archaeon]|nr:hypothetical protein [Candidatus Bathyarchaeota archaeon]
HLSTAISYYKVLTPQVLDALEYLKEKTPQYSIIATSGPYKRGGEGGGNSYGWWIEGFADRKCVATAYLRFLTYYDEREIAKKANILFSGTDVILNDFVMVGETFHAGVGNPEIGVNIGDFYESLLFFADDQTIITYDQGENITLKSIKDPFATRNSDNGSCVNVSYTLRNSLNLVKSIRILSNSTVEVSFEVPQANITKIFVPLFKSDFVDLKNCFKKSNTEIELEMITPMRAYVRLNMYVDYSGMVDVYVRPASEKERDFAILIFSNPDRALIRLRFVLPKLVDAFSSQVRYFNAYNLIKDLKIDYIMINVNRRRELEWFNCDKRNFSEVYENDEVAIFKVSLQS